MKSDNIKIISTEKFIFEEAKEPTENTRNFLSAILQDSYFIEELKNLREDYPYNPNVSITDLNILKENHSLSDLYEHMKVDLTGLVAYFHLPHPFVFNFMLLIKFNMFINLLEEPYIDFKSSPSELSKLLEFAEDQWFNVMAITIESKCTKEDLHKWIDENWEYISPEIKELPEIPKFKKGYKNMEIGQEIHKLKKEGKNIEEIMDSLSIKYPDRDEVNDKGWVTTALSRYNRWLSRFSNQFGDID